MLFSGDRMAWKRENHKPKGAGRERLLAKLADALDVNFAVTQSEIHSMQDFEQHLLVPFLQGELLYYRGERICSSERRLMPTLLRQEDVLKPYGESSFVHLDSDALLAFYQSNTRFMTVYETLYEKPEKSALYSMLAFAQHYLDISPFIDFTHSLYVALSFALKGRQEFADDVVIYTAADIGDDDTTCDIQEVNAWLSDYSVDIFRTLSPEELRKKLAAARGGSPLAGLPHPANFPESVSPTAKLIDIPTNDLMKYQQGVFLLLNNFSILDASYLTKAVRQSFAINKYRIDKAICPQLSRLLLDKAPQYRYENLLDISRAVRG